MVHPADGLGGLSSEQPEATTGRRWGQGTPRAPDASWAACHARETEPFAPHVKAISHGVDFAIPRPVSATYHPRGLDGLVLQEELQESSLSSHSRG